jgi:hypothetical protein
MAYVISEPSIGTEANVCVERLDQTAREIS